MKVLHIVDTLSSGGMEKFVVQFANCMNRNNFEVNILATRYFGEYEILVSNNVNKILLNKKNFFDINAFRKYRNILNLNSYDIIHIHGPSIYWYVLSKYMFSNVNKLCVTLYHEHDGGISKKSAFRRLLLRIALRSVSGVIAVSKDQLPYLTRYNNRVKFIPNYPTLNLTKNEGLLKYDLVLVANFRPEKNHLLALQAIKLLNERGTILRLALVGRSFNDSYWQGLHNKIDSLGISDQIEILSVSDVGEILQISKIAILTSNYEGLPLAILEYGLAGLPVISTDVGEIPTILENGKNGLLIPTNLWTI